MGITHTSHLYSTYFAPRGRSRMYTLGMQIAQQYLSPFDKIIGVIGEPGSGKSALIKGMFPSLELTNDDDGVNIRPLPLLDQDRKMGFYTPHTYHLDIRFEMDTWSDLEIPTREELVEGVENLQKYGGKIDLIITHEPPAKIKDFLMLHSGSDASITAINTYLEDVSRICQFKHWYFGSLHMDKFISSSHTCVFHNIINAKTGEVVTR